MAPDSTENGSTAGGQQADGGLDAPGPQAQPPAGAPGLRRPGPSRRAFVGGAVAIIGAGAAVAVGPPLLRSNQVKRALGQCDAGGRPAPRSDWMIVRGRLPSTVLGADVPYVVALPPAPSPGSTAARAVCFCLHGRGDAASWVVDSLRLQDYAAVALRESNAPFGLAAIDGGGSYWHRRAQGTDTMTMFLEEFIPHCATQYGLGADGRDRAVMGWSMGGYGALHAAELSPKRFRAVVASSPALWTSAATQRRAVPDAFDDAGDFAANDVFARRGALAGVELRVDCGSADPFAPAVRRFLTGLPAPAVGGFPSGCHDLDFWRKVAPAQAGFLADVLAPRR